MENDKLLMISDNDEALLQAYEAGTGDYGLYADKELILL